MKRIIIAVLLICCSCGRTVYVPVETERVKIETKKEIQKDSIFIDRVTHIETKGDTVFNTLTQYKYVYSHIRDTLLRVDSIPVIITPPPEIIYKTKKSKAQTGINWILGIICGGLILARKLRL